MSKPENHPVKPSFWKSSSGVMTAIALGIGAVGAAAAVLTKKPATTPPVPTPTPTPTTGVQAGTQNAAGQTTFSNVAAGYYYLNVLSSTNPTAALSAVGFGQLQVQTDPFNTNNWLVTAYWTAPSGATTFTDGGSTWQVNVRMGLPALLAATPPIPQSVTGLVANDWYTFSVRTEFLQNATDNGESAAGVLATVLESSGWGSSSTPPLITAAADTSSTPDTWNAAAQWTGIATTTQDAPPLWVLLGAPINVGTTTPPQPANTMP